MNISDYRRELVVPAIMLACVTAYWFDASDLSAWALAFPAALTAIIVIAVAAILFQAHRRPLHAASRASDGPRADGSHRLVRLALVAAPALLVLFWDHLGATLALLFYTGGMMVALKERRPLWILAVSIGLSIALVYLFRSVLYLRLPHGVLGLG